MGSYLRYEPCLRGVWVRGNARLPPPRRWTRRAAAAFFSIFGQVCRQTKKKNASMSPSDGRRLEVSVHAKARIAPSSGPRVSPFRTRGVGARWRQVQPLVMRLERKNAHACARHHCEAEGHAGPPLAHAASPNAPACLPHTRARTPSHTHTHAVITLRRRTHARPPTSIDHHRTTRFQ